MLNKSTEMKRRLSTREDRGVSEIVGTTLVFSLVLLISILLVGIGFSLFDGATEEFDDQLGQDTMQAIDDRLSGVSENTLDTGTELEIPHGVGDQIETFPDEGEVSINVTTQETGNITEDDIVADEMSDETSFELGTIAHETTGGVETVYQGGLLFEREGERTQIISEPGFDYDGRSIDFSFTDVSDIGRLNDGDTVFAQRNVDATEDRAAEIEGMIEQQRTLGSETTPIGFADVNITVTIETDHPDVWKNYSQERMTAEEGHSFNVSQNGDEIAFEFEFDGDVADRPEFGEGVLYSGVDHGAHLFFEEELGVVNETDGGFNATQLLTHNGNINNQNVLLHQDDYGLAVVDDGMWKVAEYVNTGPDQGLRWLDLQGTELPEDDEPNPFNESESELGPGGGADEDEWVWDDEVLLCIVVNFEENPANSGINDTLEKIAAGNCHETVVGPQEDLPELEPIYELDVTEVSVDGDVVSDPDEEIAVGDGDKVEVDFEIDNVGNLKGEQYVFLTAFFDEIELITDLTDDPVELYPHEESKERTLSFEVGPTFDDSEPVRLLPQNASQAVEFEFDYFDAPDFQIEEFAGTETGAVAGEPYDVEITIDNQGAGDEQLVVLEDPNGNIVDTTTVEIGTDDDPKVVELTWDVPFGAELGDGVTLEAYTEDHTEELDVDREPVALITDVEVTEEPLDPDGDIEVDVTVENPSAETLEDAEIWIDEGSTELIQDGQSVDPIVTDVDDEETVTFSWDIDNEAMTDWLTVETDDDEAEGLGIIERDGPLACTPSIYDGGDGTDDDPYQISNIDQLQCIDQLRTQDFELVDDVAAHGTEYWNDGDGFEPIGEQFSGQGGDPFSGDFDGNGFTIEGMTIDRFDEPFVGIFAITDEFDGGSANVGDGVTIQDIVLEDIYVRGESVVGGLVGGAGGTIERVSVDGYVESRYQQVGGIVGHGHDADLDNELVSTATVVGTYPSDVDDEHPWGADNLGIGGIVGGTGFNTDVATAYSTATVNGSSAVGGITGWTSDFDSTNEQMYWAGGHVELEGERRLDEIGREDLDDTPRAGAIAGRMELEDDNFEDSVYSDENYQSIGEQEADADDIPLDPEDMKGPQVLPTPEDLEDDGLSESEIEAFYDDFPGVGPEDAEGTMKNLDWDIWEPVYEIDEEGNIINEDFPIFAWQQDVVLVTIDDVNDPITPGDDTLEVDVTVENTAPESQSQVITLTSPKDSSSVVDGKPVTLDAGETDQITLEWETTSGDEVSSETEGEIIVSSEDTRDIEDGIVLEPREDTAVTIDDIETNEPVEAVNDRLEVTVELSTAEEPVTDDVTLRANGALVDIAQNVEIEPEGDGGTTVEGELEWTPNAADVGSADITVEVLGQEETESKTVDVISAVTGFEPTDTPPVNVDPDVISAD